MLDRTIPFYNTILKCSDYKQKEVVLPDGYSIVTYRPGLERMGKDNDVAGSCIAWQDLKGESQASSLHWLVVDENHQIKPYTNK